MASRLPLQPLEQLLRLQVVCLVVVQVRNRSDTSKILVLALIRFVSISHCIAPAPSGGLFFGAPTPGMSLSYYGCSTFVFIFPTSPSLFLVITFRSAPAFGQPAPAPAFGAPAPAAGGLFGSVPGTDHVFHFFPIRSIHTHTVFHHRW